MARLNVTRAPSQSREGVRVDTPAGKMKSEGKCNFAMDGSPMTATQSLKLRAMQGEEQRRSIAQFFRGLKLSSSEI
jgi:hypothetical protein